MVNFYVIFSNYKLSHIHRIVNIFRIFKNQLNIEHTIMSKYKFFIDNQVKPIFH